MLAVFHLPLSYATTFWCILYITSQKVAEHNIACDSDLQSMQAEATTEILKKKNYQERQTDLQSRSFLLVLYLWTTALNYFYYISIRADKARLCTPFPNFIPLRIFSILSDINILLLIEQMIETDNVYTINIKVRGTLPSTTMNTRKNWRFIPNWMQHCVRVAIA